MRGANEAYERLIHAQQNRPTPEQWQKLQDEIARERRKDRIAKLRRGVA